MASTLGVLDVLSKLREESERASTALTAQQETNRTLLQKCIEAETESGRTDEAKEALQHRKVQLEQGQRNAEIGRREAESRLRRLQKKHARRKQAAARMRENTTAAGASAVAISKKFRADAFDSVRQIGELRARLRDKRGELESAEEEKRELDVEIGNKKATRDKVKAEVASKLEAIATSCSKVDDIDRENKSLLARAKRVEGEIDEIREAQEEMQEMAVGLQRKNAILRHELRHLKRELEGDNPGQPHMLSSRDQGCNSNNNSAHGFGNGSQRSPSTSRSGGNLHQGNGGGGKQGSQFYHHSAAPQHDEGRNVPALQLDGSPYQQRYRQNTIQSNSINSGTTSNKVRAPFTTASSAMGMPELHLSSPHPGGREANRRTQAQARLSRRGRGEGQAHQRRRTGSAIPVDSDDDDAFEYHA